MRLDKYLSLNHNCTRNRAQFFIEQGLVLVNKILAKKSSYDVIESDVVEILDDKRVGFVSRSAVKLDTFLDEIGLDVSGMICLDIGASTGGFTQVLLGRGAAWVQTVDVGTLQLHPSIRSDSRVVCTENTDIRDFRTEASFDIVVGDISFISLAKLMDSILSLATLETEIILLYKPQFEVGSPNLRKTGVPKSEAIVLKYFQEFQTFLREEGVTIKKISLSAIEGEAGNREYMMWFQKKES
ncbi:MAG: TlyA family RNA methyltransferase [Candidatus Gracilibacteria bacterium]|nr:TlyA family RNA methyltransferase [Candidatus Gracilibacteria bacterium]